MSTTPNQLKALGAARMAAERALISVLPWIQWESMDTGAMFTVCGTIRSRSIPEAAWRTVCEFRELYRDTYRCNMYTINAGPR